MLAHSDDLLGRLAYPEGWHDFQWWITLRLGFQAPEMELSNEWSVQACPDLIWAIPARILPRNDFFRAPVGRRDHE
jgi:hypothetical protein